MRWLTTLGCLSLLGCDNTTIEPDGEPPEIVPRTTPDESVTDTGTPPPPGATLDAFALVVRAEFAYNGETDRFSDYGIPEVGLVPMTVQFTLVDTRFTETGILDADNSCTVTIAISGTLEHAPWAAENGAWAGFTIPPDAEVTDGCATYTLPAPLKGDTAGLFTSWGIGVAPLSEEQAKFLSGVFGQQKWALVEPYLVVAAVFSDALAGTPLSKNGYEASGFTFAWEVDGNMQIETTGNGSFVPIEAADIPTKTGLATGLYQTDSTYAPNPLLAN